VSLLFQIPSGL